VRTFSELRAESAAQMARAQRYERALVDVGNYEQAIEVVTKKLGHYKAQIDLLTEMSNKAGEIDGTIQGKASFILRDVIIGGCGVGIADQQAHFDLCKKTLKTATDRLADAKKALSEFTD